MRSRRALRGAASLATTALVLAACGGDQQQAEVAPGEVGPAAVVQASALSLGYLLPESGLLVSAGAVQIEAVRLAVADMNAAGGVLGQSVTLLPGDEGNDEAVARQSAEQLIDAGIHAVVGAASSWASLATLPLFHDRRIIMCSASNSAPALLTDPNTTYYFRTTPSDSGQTSALARRIVADGHSRVAILALADSYGSGLLASLVPALDVEGASISDIVSYDRDAPSYDEDVEQALRGSPEAVVIIGRDESVDVIRPLLAAGLTADRLYGVDGNRLSGLGAAVDPADPGILAGFTGTAPGATREFHERLLPLLPPPGPGTLFLGSETVFGGQAYDCAIVIALAVIAAGSVDPDAVRGQMLEVAGNGGTKCTTFAACKALLESGQTIDYDGVSGPIEWRSNAAFPSFATYEIWQVQQDGSIAQVGDSVVALD
jgi:branched-chain amino acid transport system substrate-binding protein